MHPITAFEFWFGMSITLMSLAVLAGAYCLHMWAILQDIAAEDAAEMAGELFEEYVENMEYRVHLTERISIENEMEEIDNAESTSGGNESADRESLVKP